MSGIHPTAVVEDGARLGEGVAVGPFSVIYAGADVGDHCRIGPHVVIHPHTRIGPRCRIHAHAVLGDEPQDLSFKGTVSSVEIGSDCWIREGVTVHRGAREGSVTRVGNGCLLMANSHLAHNVQLGNKAIVANGALLAGHVTVGEGAFVSGNVVVHQFTRIGRLAMLGGGGGISHDVPPFCITASSALNRIFGLNTVGLKRAGISPEDRLQIRRAFSIVYRQGLSRPQALEALRNAHLTGPALEWIDFIAQTKRGLCRAATGGSADEGEA